MNLDIAADQAGCRCPGRTRRDHCLGRSRRRGDAAEPAERQQRGWSGVEGKSAVLLDDNQALLGRHADS